MHFGSLQSCPTLHDPEDCSLPVFTVHGILQARILEWVTMPFSIRVVSLELPCREKQFTTGRLPVLACWICQECKALTKLLLRVLEKSRLTPLTIKVVKVTSAQCSTSVMHWTMCRHPSWVFSDIPMGLRDRGARFGK